MARELATEAGIHILNDVVLNQIVLCFGAGEDADRLTHATIARIQADGVIFAGGARWRGRWVMRLSVISAPTTERDAQRTVEAIRMAWRQVRGTNDVATNERR
jgi:glutamate/tyrosine decarboxylase-like PLP-dependent enzyme